MSRKPLTDDTLPFDVTDEDVEILDSDMPQAGKSLDLCIPIDEPSAMFVAGGLQPVLDRITELVQEANQEPDISTKSGRAKLNSLARKIGGSATHIDKIGLKLGEDYRAKLGVIIEERKRAKDYLTDLRDTIRKPLTDWEQADKKRKEAIEADLKTMGSLNQFEEGELTIVEIQSRQLKLAEWNNHNWQEFSVQGNNVFNNVAYGLEQKLQRAMKAEEERQELIRLRKEAEQRRAEEAERQRQEREKAIAEAAAEKARTDAEAKAERQRKEAEAEQERKHQAELNRIKEEKERAELEAERKRLEEVRRIRDEENAKKQEEIRKLQAEQKAREEELRAETERKRQEALQKMRVEQEAKAKADKEEADRKAAEAKAKHDAEIAAANQRAEEERQKRQEAERAFKAVREIKSAPEPQRIPPASSPVFAPSKYESVTDARENQVAMSLGQCIPGLTEYQCQCVARAIVLNQIPHVRYIP